MGAVVPEIYIRDLSPTLFLSSCIHEQKHKTSTGVSRQANSDERTQSRHWPDGPDRGEKLLRGGQRLERFGHSHWEPFDVRPHRESADCRNVRSFFDRRHDRLLARDGGRVGAEHDLQGLIRSRDLRMVRKRRPDRQTCGSNDRGVVGIHRQRRTRRSRKPHWPVGRASVLRDAAGDQCIGHRAQLPGAVHRGGALGTGLRSPDNQRKHGNRAGKRCSVGSDDYIQGPVRPRELGVV